MITVIVPIYNVEKYLGKCIESILIQSYSNFELLLIDDGSTDNSGRICDGYAKRDNRIIVFHQTNKGVGAARNLGIEKAKGRWILFIDSDDYVNEDYFSAAIAGLESETNADCIIFPTWKDTPAYSASQLIDELHTATILFESKELYYKTGAFFRKSASIYSKLYHVAIINEHNIRFQNTSVCEDVIFNISYFRYAKKVLYIKKAYYHYIFNVGILTLSKYSIRPYHDYQVTAKVLLPLITEISESLKLEDSFKKELLKICCRILFKGYKSIYKSRHNLTERHNLIREYSELLIPYLSYADSRKYKIFRVIILIHKHLFPSSIKWIQKK